MDADPSTSSELDVNDFYPRRVRPGPLDHLGRHVHADNAACRSNLLASGEEDVESGATYEIEDALTMSNCVINLAPDKAAVFREAFGVLAPGGRLAIADFVAIGDLPAAIAIPAA